MFAPPHCDDDEFVGALAHAYLQFLTNVMADDTAIYDFIDEANGTFVLRKPCSEIAYADARNSLPPSIPVVPNLSTLRESYISERGSGLSEERADTIRAVVRDFIAITTDKPITAYGRDDAGAFKETMLALPGNWSKRKGLREHEITEAAARAKDARPASSGCRDHQEEVVDPVQSVRLRRAELRRGAEPLPC